MYRMPAFNREDYGQAFIDFLRNVVWECER